MNLLKLFQHPSLSVKPEKATWTSLFFDLIFVITITTIAHELSFDVSLNGFIKFLALVLPVFWVWYGHTYYNDRFETDDVQNRIITLLQTIGVAFMALFATSAFAEDLTGFIISYILTRLLVIYSFSKAGRYVKKAKQLTDSYVIGFTLGLIPWALALFAFSNEFAVFLMFLGLGIDLVTPILNYRYQQKIPLTISYLRERFGLFTIIVLGESLILTINSSSEVAISWELAAAVALSVMLPFSIWWLYFQNVDIMKIKPNFFINVIWSYTHMFLLTGLIMMAVGIEKTIEEIGATGEFTNEVILLNLGVSTALIGLGIIDQTTTFKGEIDILEDINTGIKILIGIIPLILLYVDVVAMPLSNLLANVVIVLLALVVDIIFKRRMLILSKRIKKK